MILYEDPCRHVCGTQEVFEGVEAERSRRLFPSYAGILTGKMAWQTVKIVNYLPFCTVVR